MNLGETGISGTALRSRQSLYLFYPIHYFNPQNFVSNLEKFENEIMTDLLYKICSAITTPLNFAEKLRKKISSMNSKKPVDIHKEW